eukprot:SM000123S25854  [mRNA]  locus=s123:418476:423695:+ [translate_table: standard]
MPIPPALAEAAARSRAGGMRLMASSLQRMKQPPPPPLVALADDDGLPAREAGPIKEVPGADEPLGRSPEATESSGSLKYAFSRLPAHQRIEPPTVQPESSHVSKKATRRAQGASQEGPLTLRRDPAVCSELPNAAGGSSGGSSNVIRPLAFRGTAHAGLDRAAMVMPLYCRNAIAEKEAAAAPLQGPSLPTLLAYNCNVVMRAHAEEAAPAGKHQQAAAGEAMSPPSAHHFMALQRRGDMEADAELQGMQERVRVQQQQERERSRARESEKERQQEREREEAAAAEEEAWAAAQVEKELQQAELHALRQKAEGGWEQARRREVHALREKAEGEWEQARRREVEAMAMRGAEVEWDGGRADVGARGSKGEAQAEVGSEMPAGGRAEQARATAEAAAADALARHREYERRLELNRERVQEQREQERERERELLLDRETACAPGRPPRARLGAGAMAPRPSLGSGRKRDRSSETVATAVQGVARARMSPPMALLPAAPASAVGAGHSRSASPPQVAPMEVSAPEIPAGSQGVHSGTGEGPSYSQQRTSATPPAAQVRSAATVLAQYQVHGAPPSQAEPAHSSRFTMPGTAAGSSTATPMAMAIEHMLRNSGRASGSGSGGSGDDRGRLSTSVAPTTAPQLRAPAAVADAASQQQPPSSSMRASAAAAARSVYATLPVIPPLPPLVPTRTAQRAAASAAAGGDGSEKPEGAAPAGGTGAVSAGVMPSPTVAGMLREHSGLPRFVVRSAATTAVATDLPAAATMVAQASVVNGHNRRQEQPPAQRQPQSGYVYVLNAGPSRTASSSATAAVLAPSAIAAAKGPRSPMEAGRQGQLANLRRLGTAAGGVDGASNPQQQPPQQQPLLLSAATSAALQRLPNHTAAAHAATHATAASSPPEDPLSLGLSLSIGGNEYGSNRDLLSVATPVPRPAGGAAAAAAISKLPQPSTAATAGPVFHFVPQLPGAPNSTIPVGLAALDERSVQATLAQLVQLGSSSATATAGAMGAAAMQLQGPAVGTGGGGAQIILQTKYLPRVGGIPAGGGSEAGSGGLPSGFQWVAIPAGTLSGGMLQVVPVSLVVGAPSLSATSSAACASSAALQQLALDPRDQLRSLSRADSPAASVLSLFPGA